jgi:hypothetical protein
MSRDAAAVFLVIAMLYIPPYFWGVHLNREMEV